ncbi:MAG: stage II sporulation protein P, partial [Bacillota bacterium]
PTWNICTPDGEVLLSTSIEVQVGDQFLNEDNKLYEVVSLDAQRAVMKQIGTVDLSSFTRPSSTTADGEAIPVQARQGTVGIYHTHGWESYRPSDGKDQTVGRGGIFDVGDAMAAGFKDRGLKVERSTTQERSYNTSRRTALDLLKTGSDLIIDVHRDTGPATQYYYNIDGQPATKALLVVGRQNPNMEVNKELAYRVKGAADSSQPGLIRGIYMAQGNYNQDLSPRAMLVEFGSSANLKEAASRSAYSLAGVITELLFPPAAPSAPVAPGAGAQTTPGAARPQSSATERRAAWRSYLAWAALILVMVGGFLLINEPSWQGMKKRIKQFTNEEFGDLFGRVKRK